MIGRVFALPLAMIIFCLAASATSAQDAYPLEVRLSGPAGIYDVKRWQKDWPGCKYEDGISEGRVSIIESSSARWMRVMCRANQIGPERGGISWRRPIPATNRLELAYKVRFAADFDFAKGGKLPGMCGGPESVTGGNAANGKNGFSARFMWRADGRGEAYVYHAGQPGKFGESFAFPDDFRFPLNKPIMLIMRIDLNEVGNDDGTLETWIKLGDEDAQPLGTHYGLRWRTVESVKIDSLLCEVFHGGNDPSWAPQRDCHVDLSDFRLLQ